jgi:hypothetical protein
MRELVTGRLLEAALGWVAVALIVVALVMALLGRDGWGYVALVSLAAWIAALSLYRKRRGRIDLFDDL